MIALDDDKARLDGLSPEAAAMLRGAS